MKESFTAPGGGRGEWRDVSDSRRCPVCGSGSWCQIHRDGSVVLCKRVADGRARTNRDGVEFYGHHLDGTQRTYREAMPSSEHLITARRADVDVLDRAYRAVLNTLRLDDVDRKNLEGQGLDAEAIRLGQYRSLRVEGRAALARAVVEAVGEGAAAGVPGIIWRTDGARGWWSLGGCPGIVIPVRDIDGRVGALMIRRRDPGADARYLYLSSARHNGPSPATSVHVPAWVRPQAASTLVITEGCIKADVSSRLLPGDVVGLPGIGAVRLAVEFVRATKPWRVIVAADADAQTNADVAHHARNLVHALRRESAAVTVWQWPEADGKGLDDLLLAARTRGGPLHVSE